MSRFPSAAGGVLSYFTRHRTAANLLLVILIVAGLAAAPRMRAQFFPDVVIDDVTVAVTWEGAGAEDVDAGIVQVLEPVLMAVEGVESTESRSSEGSASINLEFEPGWDMSRAADDVQVAVDGVTTLPDEAEEPEVRRGAWRDRVTDIVITGPVAVDQLGRFADELVTRLYSANVTRTTIQGLAAPELVIEVPSGELIRHDVSMAEIAAAIAAEVDTAPAGDVSGGSARVRTGVEKRDADQIAGIVLRANDDGSKLTVGDVATVRVEGVDRARAYFVGENPAISVRVDRSAQGDAIALQHRVEDVVAELQLTLPPEVSVDLIRTRAEFIQGRLDILLDNGLMGLGLVLLLLFLFLNARTAFWVAAGIPVAMLATIALMYLSGLTINMISLFALIITLGIVVDDAIVVGEHADFRARRLGESPVQAAENAARRMAAPVFSSTLTTVIAFFGLVLIGGRFGDMIADIPFTVIAVLLASLVECFLILPNHMAHALTHSAKQHWYDAPSRVVNRGFTWFRRTLFRPFMAGVVWARYPVLALTVLLLASQVGLLIRGDVPWRFFNAPERSSVTGNFAMLPGATREDTMEMMREMQRATEEVAKRYEEEYGVNPLDYVLAQVGGTTGRGLAGADTKDEDQLGSIAIELIDADLRPYSSFQFVGELQGAVIQHPKAETVSFRGWRSGPGGDALDVQFYGADADTLKAAAEALKTEVAQYGEVSAVQDSMAYDKEELILDLTAQGTAVGFTIEELGRVLRHRLNGIEAATYPDGPRSAAIRVELPAGELTADFLERTLLRAPSGEYLPLSDIVTVERRTGFSTVRRENGLRVVSVTGDISEDDPVRAEEIMTELQEVILPRIETEHGVAWRLSGLAEQEDEFLNDAKFGLYMTLIGIYLVLAWIFSSWTRPVVVMAVIPFGLIGVVYGHLQWGVPLSMFSIVGLIGMVGIIINDSIVLVSTVDEYAETRGLFPAIIDAACDRLRPVLLTTATTVLGLAPLLFEQSQQAQFLKPTVITLTYGLGFGVVLVLLVVPALLAMQQDVGKQVNALRHALRAGGRGRPVRWVTGGAAGLMALWFAATLGVAAVTGALPGAVTALLPALAGSPAMVAALGLFLAGSAVLLVMAYFGAALAVGLARRA
ncbi:efflux RND transporter permease subunit [Rhodovulum adriaticum]|uniref:Multidrug efflux pump subunit AcrB n=1 Tax=Rhodovulum adriaticum TaxID=35804 RepID=A0A4R2NJY8_RHOAD|nr:efflux RND transporter permease subunit [Rhodovulum adriaticum]MBK1635569.1 acriflavine resistance protein B [Rhodovulum adriaticum]TCP21797.1 multidrug efflux pump subunit AcrB [Rhodovulum adriaticum]